MMSFRAFLEASGDLHNRLTRFNFGVYERFFNSHGVVIECTKDKRNKEQEIVDDIISLMSSFSAKIYGRKEVPRTAAKRKRRS